MDVCWDILQDYVEKIPAVSLTSGDFQMFKYFLNLDGRADRVEFSGILNWPSRSLPAEGHYQLVISSLLTEIDAITCCIAQKLNEIRSTSLIFPPVEVLIVGSVNDQRCEDKMTIYSRLHWTLRMRLS